MTAVFKAAGLFTVFCVCTLWGFSKSAQLKERAQLLYKVCICLEELSSLIKYEGTEKIRILHKTFGKKGLVRIENGQIKIENNGFLPSDKKNLQEFIENFGSADINTEENRIGLSLELFSKEKAAAEKNACEQGKLYRTAGICAGACICLLLI